MIHYWSFQSYLPTGAKLFKRDLNVSKIQHKNIMTDTQTTNLYKTEPDKNKVSVQTDEFRVDYTNRCSVIILISYVCGQQNEAYIQKTELHEPRCEDPAVLAAASGCTRHACHAILTNTVYIISSRV